MNRGRTVFGRSVFSKSVVGRQTPNTEYRPLTTEYRFWLILTVIITLGIGLRCLRLDWQPIWWDEGYSVYFATESIAQMLSLTARDIHPPLYYALLHAWISLTGSTEPANLRILSVIIGALALPIFAWLVQIFFRNKPRTIIATLLLAVSPMHIFYSQELRMYGLALLLGLVATARLWKLFQQPSTRNTLFYAFAISLTLYTIYYSAFLILAHAIWVLWHFRRDLKQSRPFIMAYLIAALLYLPWILYAATNLIRYVGEKIGFDNDTPLTPFQYLWRHLLAFTTGHIPNNNELVELLSFMGIVSLILLIGSMILVRVGPLFSILIQKSSVPHLKKPRWDKTLFGESDPPTGTFDPAARPAILFCFAIPVLITFVLNMRLPFFPDGGERLLLFVLPYFLLLVADGVLSLGQKSPLHPIWNYKLFRRRVGSIDKIAGLLIVAAIGIYNFYSIDRYADRDYRPVVQQVVQQGQDGDILLAIFPWQVGYWRAYAPADLRDQEPLLLGQSSLEWNESIRQQIEQSLARGGTLWFPAPLSLGSDLPLDIEDYLASAESLAELERSETVEAEDALVNVEMRWANATTRLSAWRRVPAMGFPKAELGMMDPLADFGALKLLGAAFSPQEVESANNVIDVATEWSISQADLEGNVGAETDEWRFSLRLLDARGHVWASRTFQSEVAGRGVNHAGFVVPAGLPPGVYGLAAGVDRVQINAGVEEVTRLTTRLATQIADEERRVVEFVHIGNVSIIDPTEAVAESRLVIQREAVPTVTDGGLRVLGLSGIVPGKSALAGTRISLDIFLQNQSAAPAQRSLYVSLLDADGAGVAGGEGWPLPEYPTDRLAAGALVQVPFEVSLPATLASGEYRLVAGLLDPETGAKSAAAALGMVAVTQRAAMFDAAMMADVLPSPARFGSHAELIGYDVVVGEQITLTLHWRAEQSLLPQHNIFVHLVGSDDDPLAQWDGVPQSVDGAGELILAPTGSWQAGEFLSTLHVLPLVGEVDELMLRVGLYVPETGARLPVAIDGAVVGDFVTIRVR